MTDKSNMTDKSKSGGAGSGKFSTLAVAGVAVVALGAGLLAARGRPGPSPATGPVPPESAFSSPSASDQSNSDGSAVVGAGSGESAAGGSALPTIAPSAVAAGAELFARNCAACHGQEGIGEKPDDPYAVDTAGLPLAPALDGSMHAWHHSDDGLVGTILQGSPRNPRMIAWGNAGLTEDDARNIVAYMKSTWGVVERTCQGAKHMDRNCIIEAMEAEAVN